MFAFIQDMQLALDALDRLVDTLEERGPLSAVEAARALFATPSISDGLACSSRRTFHGVALAWPAFRAGRRPRRP